MDLTMLLMTTSIFAGVHMMLFIGASTIALIYYRRYKKLKRQVARDPEAYHEEENAQRRGDIEASTAIPARVSSRGERRQRRRREEFRRQATENGSDFDGMTSRVHDSDMMSLRPAATTEPRKMAEAKRENGHEPKKVEVPRV